MASHPGLRPAPPTGLYRCGDTSSVGLVPPSVCPGQSGARRLAFLPPACQTRDGSSSSVLGVGPVSALGLGLFSSGLSCRSPGSLGNIQDELSSLCCTPFPQFSFLK